MLEIPTIDLEQRIMQELEANPLLELGSEKSKEEETSPMDEGYDDFPSDESEDYLSDNEYADRDSDWQDEATQKEDVIDYDQVYESGKFDEDFDNAYDGGAQDDMPAYSLHTQNYSADDEEVEIVYAQESSFHDYLREQWGQLTLSDRDRAYGEYVISSIDDNGYLTRSAMQIADDISFSTGLDVSERDMEHIVQLVRKLDPPGVGAANLKDCLQLQLKELPQTDDVIHAQTIVNKAFDSLCKRHYAKIRQRFEWTEAEMQQAINIILHLHPKPGVLFGTPQSDIRKNHVIPDFIVENENGELVVSLNNADTPPIRIRQDYQDLLTSLMADKQRSKQHAESIRFIKQHMESGRFFIDAIQQRNNTLLTTMQAIVRFQHAFFEQGDDAFLKPMILQDIANLTGYDISTISRVSGEKYVRTDFGTYPLRHFFSEGLDDENGQEISTRRIKRELQDIISREDKRHPLNDDQLVEQMRQNGCLVARRTVAKYREQLSIPVARLRKQV